MGQEAQLLKETPEQIASRLMSPASESALWKHAQVKALIIRAVEEERAMELRIFEARTVDGEPSGIWHICSLQSGEWAQDVDEDFASPEDAARYAEDNDLEISAY